MRREYESPRMVVEQFEANEYIAACTPGITSWEFICNAGDGATGEVYQETGKDSGLQKYGENADIHLTEGWEYYYACKDEHVATEKEDFFNGYYVKHGTDYAQPVIIWTGKHGNNVHCTVTLKENWEVLKS